MNTENESVINKLIQTSSPGPSPQIQLVHDPVARNKAVASSNVAKGKLLISVLPLSTALLPPEKGQRCDFCHRLRSSMTTLYKCSGCASYWYCGSNCQTEAWKKNHKRICKSYPQFAASPVYEQLGSYGRTEALLFSHLVAEFVTPKMTFADTSEPMSAFSIFKSLMPQSSVPAAIPPLSFQPTPAFTSLRLLNDLYARFGNNNFVIHSHLSSIAHGIFPLSSRLFNHSCTPNAAPRYSYAAGRPVRMEIVTLRPILEGEEITIPYLDPALPLSDRQQTLQISYGFNCSCPLCHLGSSLDETLPAPDNDQLTKLKDPLHEFTGCLLNQQPSLSNSLQNYADIPKSLLPFLHPSVLLKMSEYFSQAAHGDSMLAALDVGHTLLAVYFLIYPPNYPQIGMHALEMAKTAWNVVVTNDTAPTTKYLAHAQWYLLIACEILETYGPEGDEGGPLEESRLLRNLLEEELRAVNSQEPLS